MGLPKIVHYSSLLWYSFCVDCTFSPLSYQNWLFSRYKFTQTSKKHHIFCWKQIWLGADLLKGLRVPKKRCQTMCVLPMVSLLHPWKLTWHWNISIFNRKYIFRWYMFQCRVSFRGGMFPCQPTNQPTKHIARQRTTNSHGHLFIRIGASFKLI